MHLSIFSNFCYHYFFHFINMCFLFSFPPIFMVSIFTYIFVFLFMICTSHVFLFYTQETTTIARYYVHKPEKRSDLEFIWGRGRWNKRKRETIVLIRSKELKHLGWLNRTPSTSFPSWTCLTRPSSPSLTYTCTNTCLCACHITCIIHILIDTIKIHTGENRRIFWWITSIRSILKI